MTYGVLSDTADERLLRSLQFNSKHCLAQLLPALNKKDRYTLRHKNKYDIPLIKNENSQILSLLAAVLMNK